MSKKLENKTEGIPAVRLKFQTNGASGLSQPLNFPTSDGEESVAGASQDFLPQAFPQAKTLKTKGDGKMRASADIETLETNYDYPSQIPQTLGEEGETPTLANTLRTNADKAIIENYPYTWKDIQNPETGKQILTQLYWQEGLSLRRIGRIFGKSSYGILYRMQKYGAPRRDAIEACIKAFTIHKTKPFSGNPIEKAYLIGLRYGDIYAAKHSRKIQAILGTTHPAMLELFESVFKPYANVARYPGKGLATEYDWTIRCYLDSSFAFLIEKGDKIPDEIYTDNQCFLAFLAGFFDSEGCIIIGKSGSVNGIRIGAQLDNKNLGVLRDIEAKLKGLGFQPTLYPSMRNCWTLWLGSKHSVLRLLQMLPLRHLEKIEKREIVLKAYQINQWHKIEPELQAYRNKIHEDVQKCIAEAREAWLARHPAGINRADKKQPTLLSSVWIKWEILLFTLTMQV